MLRGLGTPPYDQRAGVRPISFILVDEGGVVDSVTLPIRPEDLNRTEPARATVHQTLGRDVAGWVDNFGPGLPSCTISGHTGWRYMAGAAEDGVGSFDRLNTLIAKTWHDKKQEAIQNSKDPATVKLIFVDVLDNFVWTVVPTQFVLRRSKSRPLLFQYSITLQAIDTGVESPAIDLPPSSDLGPAFYASYLTKLKPVPGGLGGGLLDAAGLVSGLADYAGGLVGGAVGGLIGGAVGGLVGNAVGNAVSGLVSDVAGAAAGAIDAMFDAAGASVDALADALGKTSALRGIQGAFSLAGGAASAYENYSALMQPSSLAGQNAFSLMFDGSASAISVTGGALDAIKALNNADPVLAPMSGLDASRYLDQMLSGVSLA